MLSCTVSEDQESETGWLIVRAWGVVRLRASYQVGPQASCSISSVTWLTAVACWLWDCYLSFLPSEPLHSLPVSSQDGSWLPQSEWSKGERGCTRRKPQCPLHPHLRVMPSFPPRFQQHPSLYTGIGIHTHFLKERILKNLWKC